MLGGSDFDGEAFQSISNAIGKYRETPNYVSETAEVAEHEIVIGKTQRPISQVAYDRLNRIELPSKYHSSFLIYSDGSSVAIAYEEGLLPAQLLAVEYFIDNCIEEKLILPAGVVHSETFSVLDYYNAQDEVKREAEWSALAEKIGGSLGKSVVSAYKALYQLYSDSLVGWYLDLYDPHICVCKGLYGLDKCENTKYCGGSGFYWSNSARDNVGYLPDIEATSAALRFLLSTGILSSYSEIPDDMREGIISFIRSSQDQNGYFYLPQWGKELVDSLSERKNRDLTFATGVLTSFGVKPYYNTPNGITGIGAPTSSARYAMPGANKTVSVSRIVAASSSAEPLTDRETFEKYLNQYNDSINTSSYGIGNRLSSWTSQIKTRDKELSLQGADYSFAEILINWLNEHQNSETGHWESESNYNSVNGIMKISIIYNELGYAYPNVDKALNATINAICSEEAPKDVCYVYNPWYAASYLLVNLSKHYSKEEATTVRRQLLELAPANLGVTAQKLAIFLKEDGSFSYHPDRATASGQGAPLSVPNTNEGDANGTNICFFGILSYIESALGVDVPHVFGQKERYMFYKLYEDVRPVVKRNEGASSYATDFNDLPLGIYPQGEENLTDVDASDNGTVSIVKDDKGSGNVVKIESPSSISSSVSARCTVSLPTAKSFVFEGKFRLESSTEGYAVKVQMDNAYALVFKVFDGRVHLWDRSSSTTSKSFETDLKSSVKIGEWFYLKMVYYPSDEENVRIKIFLDDNLDDAIPESIIAVSDNYYDPSGYRVTQGSATPATSFSKTEIACISSADVVLYVDDLHSYKDKGTYSIITDENKRPAVYVDAPDLPQKKHDFESENLGDVLIWGNGTQKDIVSDGRGGSAINFRGLGSGAQTIMEIDAVRRTKGANTSSISFDILCNSYSDATVALNVDIRDGDLRQRILNIALEPKVIDGEKYLALKLSGGIVIEGALIKLREWTTLSIDYYEKEKKAILYLNEEFVSIIEIFEPEFERLVFSKLVFTIPNNSGLEMRFDNIISERKIASFDEAVGPVKDEIIYDFESDTDGIIMSEKITTSDGEATIFGNDEYIKIPVNSRSVAGETYIFSTDIRVLDTGSGITHIIAFTDSDNNVVFALAIAYDSDIGRAYISEYNERGAKELRITELSTSNISELKIEIYPENKVASIYLNDEYLLTTSIFYDKTSSSLLPEYAVVGAVSSSKLVIDNLCFESVYKKYTYVRSDLPNLENGAPVYTFENSSTGNLPSYISSKSYKGSSFTVEEYNNELEKDYSKALVFKSVPGGNSYLNLKTTEITNAPSYYSFTADVLIESAKASSFAEIILDISGSHAYWITLMRSGDNIVFGDNAGFGSGIKNLGSAGAKVGEWFRLRIEYWSGSAETMRVKIFINDVLLSESSNYYGSGRGDAPRQSIDAVKIQSLSTSDFVIVLDNMSLSQMAAN